MSEPVIASDEAFRAILRAHYPRRPGLADEIREWRWFHHARENGVPQEEYSAALHASEWLSEQQRAGKLRLRGVLDAGLPQDIDPIHVTAGELDIWKQELKIYHTRGGWDIKHLYCLVHIVAADIQAATSAPADQGIAQRVELRKRPRYPGDADLIERAVALIDAGTALNALQAAEIVAPEAEGTSPAQKIDRLRKAIRAAIAAR